MYILTHRGWCRYGKYGKWSCIYMKLAGNNVCVSLYTSIDVYNDNNMVKFCYVIFVTFSTFIFTIFLFERTKKPFIRVEYVIPLNGLNIFPNIQCIEPIYLFLFLMIFVRCNEYNTKQGSLQRKKLKLINLNIFFFTDN